MVTVFKEACPYCGQANLSGEDARKWCGCVRAKKYRKILSALYNQSEDAEPMPEISAEVMAELQEFAHLICMRLADGVTAKLSDGTTVSIGAKVSRTVRLKVEEKVDE